MFFNDFIEIKQTHVQMYCEILFCIFFNRYNILLFFYEILNFMIFFIYTKFDIKCIIIIDVFVITFERETLVDFCDWLWPIINYLQFSELTLC